MLSPGEQESPVSAPQGSSAAGQGCPRYSEGQRRQWGLETGGGKSERDWGVAGEWEGGHIKEQGWTGQGSEKGRAGTGVRSQLTT